MSNPAQHAPANEPPAGRATPGVSPADKVAVLIAYIERYGLGGLVETGLYNGSGSCMGVIDSGVLEAADCLVIDWQWHNLKKAGELYPGLRLLYGDSAELMPSVVAELEAPALFWLDAHGIDIEADRDFPPCPLLAELETIAASPAGRGSVVLVDDLHQMGTHDWPSLEQVREASQAWIREERDNIMRLTPR